MGCTLPDPCHRQDCPHCYPELFADTDDFRERFRELTETGRSVRRTGRPIMTLIAEALGPDTATIPNRQEAQ
jgi:hypothetical protein